MKTYGIVDENGLIAKNYNGLEIPATLASSKTLTDNGEVYRKIEVLPVHCRLTGFPFLRSVSRLNKERMVYK